MFLSKVNFLLESKILTGYVCNCNCNFKQGGQYLYLLNVHNRNFYISINRLCSTLYHNRTRFDKTDNRNLQNKEHYMRQSRLGKKIVAKQDIFGILSYDNFTQLKSDMQEEGEKKTFLKEFKDSFSSDKYCDLIKSHLANKDLNLALSVLDLMKENGHPRNPYMYNLIIRAFAQQGNIKQCFKLYNKLKKEKLLPNDATYNSLINVCAKSTDKKVALEHLQSLREHWYENNYVLNVTHYNTLIKAYSWHNQVANALEIADEANDKGFSLTDICAALFHTAIGDKENGLKYALIFWYKMKIYKIKPNLTHYNLFLQAIRDTEFGDMNINDPLISESKATTIQLHETEVSDLLDFPPRLNTSLLALNQKYLESKTRDIVKNNDSKPDVINKPIILSQNLNNILKTNPLILFGGIKKILKRMEGDNVKPNIKTLGILMELLPSTVYAEEWFLEYIRKTGLAVDITLFNILIKRRSMRNQYKHAKDVLSEIQRHHLTPNIVTFGTLAIGCIKYVDGVELLTQLNSIGFQTNTIILGTLMHKAIFQKNLHYLSYLMDYMIKYRIKPDKSMLNILEKYERFMLDFIKCKNRFNAKEVKKMTKDYNSFKILYNEWKKKLQKNYIIQESNQHAYE